MKKNKDCLKSLMIAAVFVSGLFTGVLAPHAFNTERGVRVTPYSSRSDIHDERTGCLKTVKFLFIASQFRSFADYSDARDFCNTLKDSK